MAIRRRSSSPLRAGWRQGRSASGSCRSPTDPDAACPRCTTRVENAHGTGVREVLYRWHPWFGLAVHVHAAATKADGVYFRCTLNGAEGDRWQELPAWMFDRAACAGSCMLVAEPFVSMAALSALSRLLDAMGRPSPSSPQPPGLGAHSRLDRNRGEHHADGTSVTITHPAGYAATAGDDREAAPDRSVRRRHREDGADLARVAGGGARPPDQSDGATDPGSRARGRRGPVEGGQ